ncbi:lipoprotein [Alkanindiges sp. WGS2144]|uniref:LPS translocon maturation chaperone LptM n=1 Tax=Alkanindiges sp. WGS2144 TaxID=3366808 RepID=UPI0037526C5E
MRTDRRIPCKALLLCLGIPGLVACGQKGPLVLPTEQSATDNKAIYLIKPKKANGEPEPAVQTDFIEQPTAQPDLAN